MDDLRLVLDFATPGADSAEARQRFSSRFGVGLEPVFEPGDLVDDGLAGFFEAIVDAEQALGILALDADAARSQYGLRCLQVQDGPWVGRVSGSRVPRCEGAVPDFTSAGSGPAPEVKPPEGWALGAHAPKGVTLRPQDDFTGEQRHLGVRHEHADGGVGAEAVWASGIRGAKGCGITIADVELGWLPHPELANSLLTCGQAEWDAHGTAVLGLLFAPHDGLGVSGLTPEARSVCVQVGRMKPRPVAAAVLRTALRLPPGSVILLETQVELVLRRNGRLCRTPRLPMEIACDAFAAIAVAVAWGRHVVQAAGNGVADLDDYLTAGLDSGSIVVGAGAPDTGERSRVSDGSNHGSRVDLFSWGAAVTTIGSWIADDSWRDRFPGRGGSDFTPWCYRKTFDGTSAAAAIVAGTVAILSGIAGAHGRTLPPWRLRQSLVASGYHKLVSRTEGIGVHPDLVAACRLLAGELLPAEVGQALAGAA